jgi:hypothetical protein
MPIIRADRNIGGVVLEGISNLIIKQFISRKTGSISKDRDMPPAEEGVKEVTPADIDTGFSLEELRIEGMSKEQEKHIAQLVKKLLKEDVVKEDKEATEKRKKALPTEIEKRMNRYMSEEEKELLGILINKLC